MYWKIDGYFNLLSNLHINVKSPFYLLFNSAIIKYLKIPKSAWRGEDRVVGGRQCPPLATALVITLIFIYSSITCSRISLKIWKPSMFYLIEVKYLIERSTPRPIVKKNYNNISQNTTKTRKTWKFYIRSILLNYLSPINHCFLAFRPFILRH